MKNKGIVLYAMFTAMTVSLLGCGSAKAGTAADTDVSSVEMSSSAAKEQQADDENEKITEEEQEKMLQLKIADTIVAVAWEDNESVEELRKLCEEEPLTIQMSMYGGFEQVGSVGTTLPRNDAQTTTSSGDIVLYSGNQIVVFYGSNSWAYTRLGHITDQDADGMTQLLGNGDVTVSIRIEDKK